MNKEDGMEDYLKTLGNGFNQVGVLVENLEEGIEKYRKSFGVRKWVIYTYDSKIVKEMTYHGKKSEYAMRLALSNDVKGMQIELIQPLKGPSIYHDFIESRGYGFHHFGVACDNVEEEIKVLETAGFKAIQEGKNFSPSGGGHFAYIDTEEVLGYIIELRQSPPDRWPPEKVVE